MSKVILTAAQQTKIAKKRQHAINLKAEKQRKRASESKISKERPPKKKPAVGGCITSQPDEDVPHLSEHEDDFPLVDPALRFCEDCGQQFVESYLLDSFGADICDRCRDAAVKHRFISRTDAKDRYLLKDHDFDKREPILKYVLKKNPHNPMWGDMKLYLEIQVAERSMLVWGSEEALEEEKIKRIVNREKLKRTKYSKKLKVLRLAVRSSLGVKHGAAHTHEYGDETYDSDEDEYRKSCQSCGNVITYEKM